MGMYDYVVCSAPLPGTPPAIIDDDTRFQTKDLDQTLSVYEITADGRLVETQGGFAKDWEPREVPHHGDLEFYESNWCGCAEGFVFTRDGSDAVFVTYRARFERGRLQGIEEVEREVRPALPAAEMNWIGPRPTAEEIAEVEATEAESLVGRPAYVWWGGQPEGYPVEVVAEGPREWVARKPDGTFEVLDRRLRGRIVFGSEAEARADRDAERDERAARRARYEALLAARRTSPDDQE